MPGCFLQLTLRKGHSDVDNSASREVLVSAAYDRWNNIFLFLRLQVLHLFNRAISHRTTM